MRTLRRNKRPLYLCKKYIEDGITKFKEPIPKKINYVPTNSTAQLFTFGEHYAENLQAVVDVNIGQEFSEGDRCYIYTTPPKEYDPLCKDADYIVNVLPQETLNSIKLNFVRLSGTVQR